MNPIAFAKEGTPVADGRYLLKLSKDKMAAYLVPAGESVAGAGGIDYSLLLEEIKRGGVEAGLLAQPEPVGQGILCVAKGIPPVHGEDARVKLYVRPAVSGPTEIGKRGRIDFRELSNIVNVTKGLVLAEKIPHTQGTPGKNVLGQEIPAKSGKDRSLKGGKGVALSEDGLRIVAMLDGKFVMEADRPGVYDEHFVNSDVDLSVGNVVFGGRLLTVGGEVMPGFHLKCRGDIELGKGINSSSVMAGGNLRIHGGVIGPHAVLRAKGDIYVDFMENDCDVEALGNFYLGDFAVQCRARVGGSIKSTGKGAIIGGRYLVTGSVYLKELGSEAEVATEIQVGVQPALLKRKHQLDEELPILSEKVNESIKNISSLEKMKKEQGKAFSAALQERLTQFKAELPGLTQKVESMSNEAKELQEAVDQMVNESIFVYGTLYPGVIVRIGNLMRQTTTEEERAVIYFDQEAQQIMIRKMTPEEAAEEPKKI